MVLAPMWTLVQFALCREDDYRSAFELLAHAGFQPYRSPARAAADGPFPAAVVARLFQDPAVITRAVFGGLSEAGLLPVAVAASPVHAARVPASPAMVADA